MRALQGDLVPDHEQHRVQSVTLIMGSLGDLCVNTVLRQFKDPVQSIRPLFLLTGAAYVITSSVLMMVAREQRYTPGQSEDALSNVELGDDAQCCSLVDYLRSLPGWLWRVGGTFALGFFGFFCVLPNSSAWLGSSVMQGTLQGAPETQRTARRFSNIHDLRR